MRKKKKYKKFINEDDELIIFCIMMSSALRELPDHLFVYLVKDFESPNELAETVIGA